MLFWLSCCLAEELLRGCRRCHFVLCLETCRAAALLSLYEKQNTTSWFDFSVGPETLSKSANGSLGFFWFIGRTWDQSKEPDVLEASQTCRVTGFFLLCFISFFYHLFFFFLFLPHAYVFRVYSPSAWTYIFMSRIDVSPPFCKHRINSEAFGNKW